jgi:hypothetical protein
MERLIANPMPLPCGFVVKNAANKLTGQLRDQDRRN